MARILWIGRTTKTKKIAQGDKISISVPPVLLLFWGWGGGYIEVGKSNM